MQKTRILLCCTALILVSTPVVRGASGSPAPASTQRKSPSEGAKGTPSVAPRSNATARPSSSGAAASSPSNGSPASSAALASGTALAGSAASGSQAPASTTHAGVELSSGSLPPPPSVPSEPGNVTANGRTSAPTSVVPTLVVPAGVTSSTPGASSGAAQPAPTGLSTGGAAPAAGVVGSAPAMGANGSATNPAPAVGATGKEKPGAGVNLPSILPLSTLIKNPNDPASVQDTWKRTLVRYLTPGADLLTPAARNALHEALDFRVDVETEAGFFSVLNIRWEGTWALVTLTPLDPQRRLTDLTEAPLTLDDLLNLLLVKTPQGWEAALEDDPYVQALLNFLPERELSDEARSMLFPVVEGLSAVPSDAGRFRGNQEQREVEPPASARPERKPRNAQQAREVEPTPAPAPMLRPEVRQPELNVSEVLASTPGVVTYLCNDGSQAVVVVHSSLSQQCQVHVRLSAESVEEAGIHLGDWVMDGQKLGEPFEFGNVSGSMVRPESICGRLHGESLGEDPAAGSSKGPAGVVPGP